MLDTVIRGGNIVDGTGADAFVGDVGIRDGRIVAVGKVDEAAREEIDADGAIVTPGFLDLHTHYDGQVTWDDGLSPRPPTASRRSCSATAALASPRCGRPITTSSST